MKNTPRGCLTAGGAKPPRVTPYISIQLVSLCKHSNSKSERGKVRFIIDKRKKLREKFGWYCYFDYFCSGFY